MPDSTTPPKDIRPNWKQKVKLGELIHLAAREASISGPSDNLKNLLKDPIEYFDEILNPKQYKVPGQSDEDVETTFGGHRVVVHINNENTTHISIPYFPFMPPAPYESYVIPEGYHPDHEINQDGDNIRPYLFRVGDYTFAQCG